MHISLPITALCLAAGLICPAAMADATSTPPQAPQAVGLLPLDDRQLGAVDTTSDLNEIATNINDNLSGDEDSTNVLDLQNLPIVRDLVDEEGNVNLPLGIRVYDTMGDVSVGFGSDF